MGQLRKEQTDHMTPWREGARLFIDPVLPGEFFRQMRPDEFTKLMQGAAVVFGRRYVFHTADSLVGIRRRPPFLSLFERQSHYILWDGCVYKHETAIEDHPATMRGKYAALEEFAG